MFAESFQTEKKVQSSLWKTVYQKLHTEGQNISKVQYTVLQNTDEELIVERELTYSVQVPFVLSLLNFPKVVKIRTLLKVDKVNEKIKSTVYCPPDFSSFFECEETSVICLKEQKYTIMMKYTLHSMFRGVLVPILEKLYNSYRVPLLEKELETEGEYQYEDVLRLLGL
jgi:hypothetical protein